MAAKKKVVIETNIDNKKSVRSLKQMEDELNELKDAIREIPDVNSEAFKSMAADIAKAEGEIKNLELSMEGLDAEQKASEFGSFAAGIADTATGVAVLSESIFGANSGFEEMATTLGTGIAVANSFRGGIEGIISFQKLLRNSTLLNRAALVQETAAITANNTAKEASTAITKQNSIATKGLSLASMAQSVATGVATAAMKVLNFVMSINPVFLLISGIAALVGAFALFGSGAADAAKEGERLNLVLEQTTRAMERQSQIAEELNAANQKEISRKQELINSEIKFLQSIKNRTDEQEKLLQKRLGEKEALEFEKISSSIEEAETKTKGFGKAFITSFESIDNAITQTDIEDGINDINYDEARGEVAKFALALKEVMESDLGAEEKAEALKGLRGEFDNTLNKLEVLNLELGEAEQEKFEGVISGFKGVGDLLEDNISNLTEYNELIQDKNNLIALKEQEKLYGNIIENDEKLVELEKERKRRQQEFAREQERLLQKLTKVEQDIRLKSIEDDVERSKEAAKIKYENELSQIKGNSKLANELRKKLEIQFQMEIAEIEKKATIDRFNQLDELYNDLYSDETTNILQELDNRNSKIDELEKDGVINFEEAQKMRLDATRQANNELLELERQKQNNLNELRLQISEGQLTDVTEEDTLEQARIKFEEQRSFENEKFKIQKEDLDLQRESNIISQQEYNLKLELLEQQHQDRLIEIQENSNNKQKEEAQKLRDAKVFFAESTASSLASIGQSIDALAGRSTAAGKAFAIASLAIDTAKALSATIAGAASAAAAGGPAAPFLLAGYIASGVATVLGAVASAKQILSKAKVPGGGGGGTVPSVQSPNLPSTAPVPPTINNQFQGAGTETIGEGAGIRQKPQLIKAVVVETDITNTQNTISTIEQQSEIG